MKNFNVSFLRISFLVFLDGCHSGCEREGRGRGSKFRLHVQAADHWQQQRGENVFPVPVRWRRLHLSFRQHSGHRLQSEDRVQERQEDQTADLGMKYSHASIKNSERSQEIFDWGPSWERQLAEEGVFFEHTQNFCKIWGSSEHLHVKSQLIFGRELFSDVLRGFSELVQGGRGSRENPCPTVSPLCSCWVTLVCKRSCQSQARACFVLTFVHIFFCWFGCFKDCGRLALALHLAN